MLEPASLLIQLRVLNHDTRRRKLELRIPQQQRGRNVETLGNPRKSRDGDVAFPSLDLAVVGAMHLD